MRGVVWYVRARNAWGVMSAAASALLLDRPTALGLCVLVIDAGSRCLEVT